MKSSVMMLVAFFVAGFLFVSCSMDENTITNSSGSMEKLNGNAVKGSGHFTEDDPIIVDPGNLGDILPPETGASIVFTSHDQYGNPISTTKVNFMSGDIHLGWGYMLLSQSRFLNHTATVVPNMPSKYRIVAASWTVSNATIIGSSNNETLNFSTNYFTNLSQGMSSLPYITCLATIGNQPVGPDNARSSKTLNTESWNVNLGFYLHIVNENGNFER